MLSASPDRGSHATPTPRDATWAIVGATLLAGYVLRVFKLGDQSLWWDEAYSLRLAQQDVVSLTLGTAADFHPPLYLYLLKLWIGLVGTVEFSIRYLSTVFGLLLVPTGYVVASRLFGKRVALVTAALAAFSPLYIHYSQESRMYTLMGLLSQLAVYFFLQAATTARARDWVAYVAFMVLALYSHLYAALIFFFLCLSSLFGVVTARPLSSIRSAGAVRTCVLAQFGVLALFLPWLPVALDKSLNFVSRNRGSSLDWILEQTAIVFSVGHSILDIRTSPSHADYSQDRALALALTLPFVAVAALGTIAALWGRRIWARLPTPITPALSLRSPIAFTLAYLIVPLCLITVLSLGRLDFNGRYLFAASPAYYMLVAAGLTALGIWRRGRLLPVVAILILAGIWGYALSNYNFVEKYSRDDHRSAVAYVREQALPGDLVVLDADFDPVYTYYGGDQLSWIRFPQSIPPVPQQTLDTLARVVPSYRRVWLIMWGDYFLDPDRVVERWLDANAFRMDGKVFHGTVIVYGYLTASPLTEAARPSIPVDLRFGDQLSLLGYDLTIDESQARRRLHLTLYWQAHQRIPVNYSVFAHLLNPAGQMLGLGDSQPVNGYLPMTTWEPGRTIRSEMDVWLYPAAPPGDYRLVVGVYDQSSMRRLSTRGGDVVDLGAVRFAERSFDETRLDRQAATAVQFGDAIQLIGHRVVQPGEDVLRVTLFWKAQQKPTRRFTVFNHLVDSSGRTVAQQDGEPDGGHYPTDRWEPGEVVRDEYEIRLPANLSGSFRLLTGLYSPENSQQLPVRDWWPLRRGRSSSHELAQVQLGR